MNATNIFIAVGVIAFAYLIGSVNFAVIFSNLFTGRDVRKYKERLKSALFHLNLLF